MPKSKESDLISNLLKGSDEPSTPVASVNLGGPDMPEMNEKIVVTNASSQTPPNRGANRMLIVLLGIAFLLSAGTAYYFYNQYQAIVVDTKERTEIESAVAVVGKHIMLPTDVTPRIGKIANTDDFEEDPFLSQAEIGDLVLFYPYDGAQENIAEGGSKGKTVKAILWRPKEGKIVDVSLVSLPELPQ